MAFEGYLIKIGDYTFPMEHIAEKTYKATPHQRLDLDSDRDNLGELFREVAENRPTVIGFQTVSGLTNKEVKEIFGQIEARYLKEDEQKVSVTYYNPKKDEYSGPDNMYMPSPEFPIDVIDKDKKEVIYESIAIKFIGY